MLLLSLMALLALGPGPDSHSDEPTFERDIRPLLKRQCVGCHSAKNLDDPDTSGGLALDSFAATLKGTPEHTVVVLGQAQDSPLYQRLLDADEDRRMPRNARPFSETQRELIRRWIDAGAVRGQPVTTAESASATAARTIRRTLDVRIPSETSVPKDVPGLERSGSLELVVKLGPLPAVTALAFRGDGRNLAVGGLGQVVIWDMFEARPVAVLGPIPGAVHALAYTRDGRKLAIGAGLPGRSGVVRIYTVPDGSLVREFQGHTDVVNAVAFRRDEALLATASFDQTVRLWNVVSGDEVQVFKGHSDFVYDVAFTRDCKALLSVSKDRTIKKTDLTGGPSRTFTGANDEVLTLAVPPDGSGFLTSGAEPAIKWWGPEDERPIRTLGGHSGPVHRLSFASDGRRLISAGGDGQVRLWDGRTGTSLRTLPMPGGSDWQYSAALSPDSSVAVAGGWDGRLRFWDASSGRLLATLLQTSAAGSDAAPAADWLIALPNGLVAASSEVEPLLRWSIGGGDASASPNLKSILVQPETVARALRGEPVTAPSFRP